MTAAGQADRPRALVWFRADLRVSDNPALHDAARRGEVIAVFLPAFAQWREHDWGDPKINFVLRSSAALSDALGRLNIPLLIAPAERFADAPRVLLGLARQHRCAALHFNREYEVNERRRDEAVTQAFESAGLAVRAFDDQTVVPPDALRTGGGRYYTVFTPFKNAWLEHVKNTGEIRPLPAPKPQAPLRLDGSEGERSEMPNQPTSIDVSLWPAGEAAAQRRLAQFIDTAIADYHARRDLPIEAGTSALSPYLSAGCISARQCLAAARAANAGKLSGSRKGPDTWISELIWREFYRHVLVGFPRVCMNRAFKLETERLAWSDDESRFAAWAAGRTGVPIVDAGIRQMLATGWMHNRLRMITAMYLTKDLRIHWQRGEKFFMRHLVDADLAQNNGGWQWSASTGTDAAPYFRIFNPYTQGEKCDPGGEFVRRYVPELREVDGGMIHDPTAWPPLLRAQLDYPEPIVDHAAARQETISAFQALRG